jgi:cell division protein FtsW (lipid II flippase)
MDQQVQPASQPATGSMSVKDWFLTLLITYIPLVGLVMLLVWAFDSNTNMNKKNWAKASLLWMVVGIAIAFIIFVLFMGAFLSLLGSSGE